MDWSELIPSLVRTPITIYQNRFFIQHWWIRLLAKVNVGDTDVVIMGRPSVGKTILSRCLHGQAPSFNYKVPDTSPKVEIEAIKFGDWTKLVRVIPGQTDNKQRDIGLNEAFNSSLTLQGVIYVTDFGYSEPRDLLIKKSMIVDKKIDTIQKAREYYLEKEIEDIKILAEMIRVAHSNGRGPKWLIIAVNKVDLFLNQIDDAQKYYSTKFNSSFTDVIKEMQQKIGSMNIICETLPITAWQKDYEWNGEIAKTNLGGKEVEFALSMNFISKIAEISKAEL